MSCDECRFSQTWTQWQAGSAICHAGFFLRQAPSLAVFDLPADHTIQHTVAVFRYFSLGLGNCGPAGPIQKMKSKILWSKRSMKLSQQSLMLLSDGATPRVAQCPITPDTVARMSSLAPNVCHKFHFVSPASIPWSCRTRRGWCVLLIRSIL